MVAVLPPAATAFRLSATPLSFRPAALSCDRAKRQQPSLAPRAIAYRRGSGFGSPPPGHHARELVVRQRSGNAVAGIKRSELISKRKSGKVVSVCAAHVLADAVSLVRVRAVSDRTGFLGGLVDDTEMTAFLARTTAVFADPSNFSISPWLLFLGSPSMIVVSVTLILSNFLTAFFVFIPSPGRL